MKTDREGKVVVYPHADFFFFFSRGVCSRGVKREEELESGYGMRI